MSFASQGLRIAVVIGVCACGGEAMEVVAPVRTATSETTVRSGPVHLTPASDPDRLPEKYVAPIAEDACLFELSNVLMTTKFPSGESAVAGADDVVLAAMARCVMSGALAGRTLLLIGHADPRGTPESNRVLGLARARALLARFEALGVERGLMRAMSRGDRDAAGTDEASWSFDRRVDIVLAEQ